MTVARETLVKKFARLNRVDTALARKQFTEDGERLLSQTDMGRDSTIEAWDGVLDQWRTRHGLVAKELGFNPHKWSGEHALDVLTGRHGAGGARGGKYGVVDTTGLDQFRYGQQVWDHERLHALPSGRLVAVSLAPYQKIRAENPNLVSPLVEDFMAAVRTSGLSVRVGFSQDQYYGFGSLPILIWNPNYVGFPVV